MDLYRTGDKVTYCYTRRSSGVIRITASDAVVMRDDGGPYVLIKSRHGEIFVARDCVRPREKPNALTEAFNNAMTAEVAKS